MMIVKTTYKDQVIEHIYELILDGLYSPGDQIKESLLAKEMGISRAPVREALKELIASGIIAYRPQVGNFIALLSPKEIIDAYTLRGVLEGYAIMETREEFTENEIGILHRMVEEMQNFAHKGDRKMVVKVGGDFHDFLVSKNINLPLGENLQRLSLRLHVLFYRYWSTIYTPGEIGARHLRIVSALAGGNSAQIEETVRQHYTETGTKIALLQK
ncbi:MAG: GntR family transcriptional regulator [Deltaproteobacteria bacterium]|nr:GntR family transcriptional regulator [Deltaproteobacteria bacterium]